MPTAVVELIGDHDRRSPEQWVERIRDLHLAAQIPGIMRSRRTKGWKNRAMLASSIETRKLHRVNPEADLTNVPSKLVNNWPNTPGLGGQIQMTSSPARSGIQTPLTMKRQLAAALPLRTTTRADSARI
jgi:hypothetical protein